MKTSNRIISFLLAALMVITFALPVSAMEIDPVQDVIDMTSGTEIVFGGEVVPPANTEPESADANCVTFASMISDTHARASWCKRKFR